MFRLLIILLIVWLPVQSIAATLCPHRAQLDISMGVYHDANALATLTDSRHQGHDTNNENHENNDNNDIDHDTNSDVAHADAHCASCHLSAVNMLKSDTTNYYFPQSIRFPSAIVNQPPNAVSAVPEPVPLA